ncbi:amidase [Acetobacteraceae bacterium H6797]|nr:amidase [Acetobacteraceae bacterium H6797]
MAFEDEPSGFTLALAALAAPVAPPAPVPPPSPVETDPALMSMTEVADAFARGEMTAESIAAACLARIAAHAEGLNCVTRLEAERALADARALDQARSRGEATGPLAGSFMMHKDMYYRAGQVTGCGSKIRRDYVPEVTATVLARLDEAGAIDAGTLHMAEFAQNPTGHNAHWGDCRNPWNHDYCTGGSSSGSGSAVGGRLVHAALGSDTGGSIRLPAAMCGVTGLKPTQTRVSRFGVMPLSFSCDNVGPLARSARDCARFLDVIAGRDPLDATSAPQPAGGYEAALGGSLAGLRISVPQNGFLDDLPADVLAAFQAALDTMAAAGATVTPVALPSHGPIQAAVSLVSRVESATIHATWMRERPQDYGRGLSARIYGGYAVPGRAYVDALALRAPLLRQFVAEALTGYDLVATPSLRDRTPTRAETDIEANPETWSRHNTVSLNTRPFNYLGLPVVSIPCGFDANGMPVGLQLAARPFGEAQALAAADAFQRITDWHQKIPAAYRP